MFLSSPGGSLKEGLAIGAVIHERSFTTAVIPDAECSSACAFAWLAGEPRTKSRAGLVGFHAVSLAGDVSSSGNAVLGAYLNTLGFPIATIAYMTETDPSGMRYLSPADARSYGINVVLVDKGIPNEWIGYQPTAAQPPEQAPAPVPPAAPEPANCHPETIITPGGVARAKPNLQAKELWKLGGGSAGKVLFCGKTETDARGIQWHWVTFWLPQEQWDHRAWMSSKILADPSQMNRPTAKESPGAAPERPGPPARDGQRDYDRDLAICQGEAAAQSMQAPRFPCRGIIPCLVERGDIEEEKTAIVNGCLAERGWQVLGR